MLRVLPWQRVFFHLFSRHNLCTAKRELLRDSKMLPHKWPVIQTLSLPCSVSLMGQLSNETQKSAEHNMDIQCMSVKCRQRDSCERGLLLQTACAVLLLFSLAVTEQREGCLDWPEFASVLCNIMGAHQLHTQTSLILLPCSLHTWHSHPQLLCETPHCLFHPSPRPTYSKITARKWLIITFTISGGKNLIYLHDIFFIQTDIKHLLFWRNSGNTTGFNSLGV